MKKVSNGELIGSRNVRTQYSKSSGDEKNAEDLTPFRLTAKNLLLTYSNISLSKEQVLNQMSILFENQIQFYAVFKEEEKLSIYLSLKKKVDMILSSSLDLKDEKNQIKIKGNYKTLSVKEKNKCIESLKNKTDLITNLFNSETIYRELYKIAREQSIEEAMKYLEKTKPEWIATRYKNIHSNLKSYVQTVDSELFI